MQIRLLLLVLLGFASSLGVLPALGQQTVLFGTVKDAREQPLPFANVVLADTPIGAATDLSGRFVFTTSFTGRQEVQAMMLGFEDGRETVVLGSADSVEVHFVLKEQLIQMEEAIVTASAYATGDAEAVTLESLEVLTTPGAAADILLAIKTFPGVAMVDEGAGLFVRGGDVDETVLLLDQATVTHPYKHETPTGGVFGTIPPFLVGGTYFSSGGFSAKYGNALSGILAMESLEMPEIDQYTVNLGLAAASTSGAMALIPGKLGVRFSGNRSFTRLMMRVNGIADEFALTPRGWDGNLSLMYAYSSTGRFKFFNFGTSDRVGVRVKEPSFDGIFAGSSDSRLHNLQWSDVFGPWLVQASLSLNHYTARQTLGILALEPIDRSNKLRIDLEREATASTRVYAGLETERLSNRFRGQFPDFTGVLDPDAVGIQIDATDQARRSGGYVEMEWKATRQLALRGGIRVDYHNLLDALAIDPRLSLLFALNKHLDVRAAWGVYRQFPTPAEAARAPYLKPQKAQHFIAGVHYDKGPLLARLEAYAKPYRNLVIQPDGEFYQNAGRGHAKGVDLFVKYGGFLRTRVNGWIAYSWLESDRTQLRTLGTAAELGYGPSPFDITNNLTLVVKGRVLGFLSAGFTFRHATGRPFTPVVDAIQSGEGAFYLPVEGAVGSERLRNFQRLDTSLSYYLPFGRGHNATFYLAISNLLDRANVLGYDYNTDYSQRIPRTTNYSRFVYFGASVSINRFPQ